MTENGKRTRSTRWPSGGRRARDNISEGPQQQQQQQHDHGHRHEQHVSTVYPQCKTVEGTERTKHGHEPRRGQKKPSSMGTRKSDLCTRACPLSAVRGVASYIMHSIASGRTLLAPTSTQADRPQVRQIAAYGSFGSTPRASDNSRRRCCSPYRVP